MQRKTGGNYKFTSIKAAKNKQNDKILGDT